METRPPLPACLAFGPFEIDVSAGQLYKSGIRVRLSGQPFQILLMLLTRPGEILSREQLRKEIWGEGTFVDFEHSLNAAINKLRRTLADSAQSPQYIETVPGFGYRFIGSIQEQGNPEAGCVVPPSLAGTANDSVASQERPKTKARLSKRSWWIVAAAVLASFIAGYFYLHRAPILTEKDTIVLADFMNTTGDPVFDGTLREGLEVQLQQSPFLGLISDQRIQRTLRLMGQPAGARLTPELAREICERTGSAAVLEGSIARLGNQYVLGLRARNCGTGDVLDEEQAQALRKEEVLSALSKIATKFRIRVGESLATVEKHSTPLAEATTPSLDALKAYSTGGKVAQSMSFVSAIPFLKRAIEIDPKFAIAYAYLGLLYSDIGESVLSTESTTKAYELRNRASDAEKFFIELNYERQVTGNLEKAQQIGELWAQTYPRDPLPHGLLSGFIYQGSGKFGKSIEEAKRAIGLDPDLAPAYVNLAASYFWLDRLDEVENTIQRASERKLEIPELLLVQYQASFLKGNPEGMRAAVARAKGNLGAEDWISHREALVLARSGQLRSAGRMARRAVDLAQQAGNRERAATFETAAAVWQGFFGNVSDARRSATKALELSEGRDVEYAAAFALALAGDSSKSQALANDLERRFPEDTSVRFNYLPVLRGLSALNHGEPSRAIEALQIAAPDELAQSGIRFFGLFGGLYSAYVRGEAYLATRQSAAAAAEFQKILDHCAIVCGDPVDAITRLQLGRAFASSKNMSKAKAAYQDFLTLWKDADPDIPILRQAKVEYARLQ